MLGAIAGDVIGSVHEWTATKTKEFPLFVRGSMYSISLGGDADTLACITGVVAEAYYGGVPRDIAERVMGLLDERIAAVIEQFQRRFSLT
jgi:ADP-ribosylglycohydrolase